ncbi:allantoate amidohydrolase [Deinococcus peraridilitoris]|uniref:Amidase, hydantoinase/carbamoylase family n=1 Tax=Deinococcus peraridilitoris (strain DSM 19664 / LMG 22246 / CIP 109416 / KR-200) TaxID=937777 RepID=K9ZX38_DEIPD|nr:allantoate amidohydrolase [Deinococcus peraridilitoris]AFZ65754.1 amidase, hydantoinase/carbamoylase family [Deinococcus peraridilitoris DSM 19664]
MNDRLGGLARKVMTWCDDLAQESEEPNCLTRTFCSAPMTRVHSKLARWAEQLGMVSSVDAAGNFRAVFPASAPTAHPGPAATFLIASHLDSVPNAGRFDGVLGVVMGLALVEALASTPLSYALEVIGFSEEEGVRFGVPFFGSRALVGRAHDLLGVTDARGISFAEALRDFGLRPEEISRAELQGKVLGYLEFHNEQGPGLATQDLPLGLVSAIAGQSRLTVTFRGEANHAGTTPMHLRRDALSGASAFVLAVEERARETPGLVATVGQLRVSPGATNVIPGEVELSLDLRHTHDEVRLGQLEVLRAQAEQLAASRRLDLEWTLRSQQKAVPMDTGLRQLLREAAAAGNVPLPDVPSGAGHDAMIIAERAPVAMVFVRSPDGLSHHPHESVREDDVKLALQVGLEFLRRLDAERARTERP